MLGQYLVLAPYGNNVHGIAYAARRYFDKPVEDLSWAETALLAGVPQAPGEMDLYSAKGRARAVERAVRILDRLAADGTLDTSSTPPRSASSRASAPGDRPIRPRPRCTRCSRSSGASSATATRGGRRREIVRTSLDLELHVPQASPG